MPFKSLLKFLAAAMVATLLLLLVFATLSWFQIPSGRFADWVIGLLSFWWLLVIVTVPWNMYFRAKEVLVEASHSAERRIKVKPEDVEYVTRLARRSLNIALGCHAFSVVGLYILAAAGISSVGYIGSGAALLLTGLRPALRAYEYVAMRLSIISREIKYPREDVVEVRNRVAALEQQVRDIRAQLDPNEPTSWAATQQKHLQATQDELTKTRVALENLRVQNQAAHEQLARDAQQAIAQLTQDSQFLEHAREIIRFFKSA